MPTRGAWAEIVPLPHLTSVAIALRNVEGAADAPGSASTEPCIDARVSSLHPPGSIPDCDGPESAPSTLTSTPVGLGSKLVSAASRGMSASAGGSGRKGKT